MKARVLSTNEIIEVCQVKDKIGIMYCSETIAYYPNELEIIPIDWEHRRYEIAKEVVRGVALNADCFTRIEIETTVKNALKLADLLIAGLKEGGVR